MTSHRSSSADAWLSRVIASEAVTEHALADLDAVDLAAVERQLEASVCRASFADFVRGAWPIIEPTRALLPSVAVEALCTALQAVADRRIRRLAIACPPGVSKSLLAAVAFPAWLLLRSSGTARIMTGSYAWDLASRDSRRCRDLVESPWFRDLVAGAWSVRDDADRRDDWWTTASGRRLVTSTGAKALGERATFQILDDVLSGADVHSEAKRKEAVRWIGEVLPSRLEDTERDARVLVGQRLHVEDPLALAIEQGWSVLSLPAVLGEDDAPCELYDDAGDLVWCDPRRPGEPLVSLLSTDALARLKTELGSSAFAAQYLQRPHDSSSSMFPRACFARTWRELPERFDAEVIALDASFKAGSSSDYAVIQCWGAKGADRFLVEQVRRQMGFADTLAALRAMVQRHPYARVLVEGAANGHAVLDQLRREIPSVFEIRPDGGKVARAASVQAIIESGAVVLPEHAPWREPFVDEVSAFPNVKHDDQTDAMVYALRELATGHAELRTIVRRWMAATKPSGMTAAELERAVDLELGIVREEQGVAAAGRPLPRTAAEWKQHAAQLEADYARRREARRARVRHGDQRSERRSRHCNT